jgi:hypothetical protein
MKYLIFGIFIIEVALFGCRGNERSQTSTPRADTTKQKKSPVMANGENDTAEIQSLVRNMLIWSDSKNVIELVPAITNGKDSIYTDFDLNQLNTNLEKLKATGFFSTEFLDNYNQIILTLDKEMKDKKFAPWSTGELPPFNFANDVDPWCDCQDVPYDSPDARALIEVGVISLKDQEGDLFWKWGKLGPEVSKDWRDFRYKFKVKKEAGKWKISYLEGFDFKDSIKS